MTSINAICMAMYFLLFTSTKSKDSLVVLLAFSVSVLYTSSAYFVSHDAYLNHLIISMCFIPAFWFLSKISFISVLLYSIYHWIVSYDYIFYGNTDTLISSTFSVVSPLLNILIMVAIFYDRNNGQSIKTYGMGRGWLPDFLHSIFNNKEIGKKQ